MSESVSGKPAMSGSTVLRPELESRRRNLRVGPTNGKPFGFPKGRQSVKGPGSGGVKRGRGQRKVGTLYIPPNEEHHVPKVVLSPNDKRTKVRTGVQRVGCYPMDHPSNRR